MTSAPPARQIRTTVLVAPIALALLAISVTSSADDPVATVFAPFNQLLELHVTEHDLAEGGLVTDFDYRAALENERYRRLDREQTEALAAFDPDRLETREQAVAFWINAYNFFMISHIIANPHRGELIDSVRDYGSLFNPYRVFRRDLFDVGGRRYSLSEIENDILLGAAFAERGWKDARVHFAVNCASVGCPPLRDHIYTAANLDRLLEDNTRRSLATPLHLDIRGHTLWLSSLFDWYEADYIEHSGSVRTFLREHVDDRRWQAIEATDRTRHIDYDWDLNSPRNMRPHTGAKEQ